MRVLHSPEPLQWAPHETAVFLAGSIDMGGTEDWQGRLIASLHDVPGVLLNPRRAHWDPACPPDAAFPAFREQVEWELAAMERADRIAFFFAPGSQAPVTLLELGLAARGGKAVVCCPPGYWRKGNVDVVCQHHGIPMVETLAGLAAAIRTGLASA
jgi:hypothetical protein